MSERLDRIEAILDRVAERQDRLAERQDRFQAEMEESKARQDRFQEQLEQSRREADERSREADERMTRIETELDENFQYIGTELGLLTRGLSELRLQVSNLVQVAEQDRSQAAIDRAEFRSTVERLVEVLTARFTRNGQDEQNQ